MDLREGTRFMVLAPIVRGRKGEYGKQLEELRAEGFTRVRVDGELRRLDEEIVLDKKYRHDIGVVVDRLVMRPDLRKRLADSIETAVALADGIVEIELVDDERRATFSEKFACLECGISFPELEPRIFSFNAPHGACPRCTGLGSQMEIDPELVVPDPTLSIGEGAIAPWSASASNYYEQLAQAITERYEVDLDAPWQDLPEEQRDFFLYGTNGDKVTVQYRNRFGRKRTYTTGFEGIVTNLERRYKETDSDWAREKIEEYMSVVPCPECRGRAAAARVARGAGRRDRDPRLHGDAGAARARWVRDLELTEQERRIARLVLREIEERLRVPRERRRRLPVDGPRGGDAVGRRGAADPARDADRLRRCRRALHPRRAVDRPAPARQREADRDAAAAARPRQHRARGRARRGHDARRRPPDRHGARGRASTAATSSRRARPRRSRRTRSRRRASSCPARGGSRCRRDGADRPAMSGSRARRSTTSRTST